MLGVGARELWPVFSAGELRDGGFGVEEILRAGCPLFELRLAGAGGRELAALSNASDDQMREAGFRWAGARDGWV